SASPLWPENPPAHTRLLINKIDLPPAWDLSHAADALHVSALTGSGLPELCDQLAQWLVPEPPPAGAAVPFTRQLCEKLEEAKAELGANVFGQLFQFDPAGILEG